MRLESEGVVPVNPIISIPLGGQIWVPEGGGTRLGSREQRMTNSGHKPGRGWEVGNKGLCFFKKQLG